eukprot:scaffold1298_cov382-Prasinococcus_capsulatus_cf.AAC.7
MIVTPRAQQCQREAGAGNAVDERAAKSLAPLPRTQTAATAAHRSQPAVGGGNQPPPPPAGRRPPPPVPAAPPGP